MTFVELNDASVVRNGNPILDHVSLKIRDGQHTAILGPNGSGKSTLMKLLSCQIYPLARETDPQPVLIFGKTRWDVFELRTQLGIVSSEMHQTFVQDEDLNAHDAVVSGFFASQGITQWRRVTPDMEKSAKEALELMGVTSLAHRKLGTLSTGEARRVLIARALAPKPVALLLDEPTTGLDIASRYHLLETLRALVASGTTLILITHHVEEIIPEIERVVVIRDGKIYKDGPKDSLLTNEVLSESFGIGVAVAEQDGYFSATQATGYSRAS
jgi:iron complex transport system ATP-binding protein